MRAFFTEGDNICQAFFIYMERGAFDYVVEKWSSAGANLSINQSG
jgi:hypothetical protein